MRISLNWLSDYVDIKKIPVEDLAKALTDSGLEVEAVETISSLKGDVVVGQVLHAEKHPDADTLRVCKVDVGQGDPLDIVCGAPNARAGIKACVAMVGSTLPGDFKIKKSKIRGAVSNGMLCAEDELGLSKNHDTIIEVDAGVALGTSVAALYNLNDTVITLGITPNRGDCLGYIGVARDLAAKLGLPLKYPNVPVAQLNVQGSKNSKISVKISDPEDCPRFCALTVSGVKPFTSPVWMQRRLEASGMRPINSIVDVTNYVMLEYGQPTHAYDTQLLRNNCLEVRRAKSGEQLKTLDGQERTLVATDLVISDGQNPIGLAGVMGGEHSEVKDNTNEITIEVASFDAGVIRKAAKRLALHTEASHRFERGTDAYACDSVAWRCVELLKLMAVECGQSEPIVEGRLVDEFLSKVAKPRIALRAERARQILGLSILEPSKVISSLQPLGIQLLDQTADKERLLFEVPSWRRDISREIDLIEEVGRMIGYDQIPYRLPLMEIGSTPENPLIDFIDQAKRTLAGFGFTEVVSFPFVGEEQLNKFLVPKEHPFYQRVLLANPLSESENSLRPCLALSLINAVQGNRRHGVKGSRLFECGRSYTLNKVQVRESESYLSHLNSQGLHMNQRAVADQRCIERSQIGFVFDQPYSGKNWLNNERFATFFDAKAELEKFIGAFARCDIQYNAGADQEIPYLHPAASALAMVNGVVIAYVGELHPEVALTCDFDAKNPPVICEINLDRCLEALKKPIRIDTAEKKFPPVNLDLAFVVEKNLSYQAIQESIKRFNGKRNLRGAKLFDVYQGDNLPQGKKSVAIAFSFQSPKRTLNDKEVELEVSALKDWLKTDLGAELR